jgi:serine protease AprX
MKFLNISVFKLTKTIVTLLLFSLTNNINGQSTVYSYFYRVYFNDKGENTVASFTPGELLSPRALARRQKAKVPVPDFRDIPVSRNYLRQLSDLGLTLHCTSKWMNSALFKTVLPADINKLLAYPFVSDVKIVKTALKNTSFSNKLDFQIEQTDLSPFNRPITMLDGYALHDNGFDGKGVLIAVLDGGFLNADTISSLSNLRARNGIKRTRDFVYNNEFVYSNSTHGTAVLSVLAGNIPGQIEGTAPGADFLLLKTEDVDSEFPCEEDFWAAGAEYADSIGADIISSSLGYYNFDDPTLNYKISDLNGSTAFVTIAADIAASKGILVVNSAGNERDKAWKRIIFPADGHNVIAVGAVDGNNTIATFSSAGPSSDHRIKPDNVTMGVNTPVQPTSTSPVRSSGTSFSCPVLSGMLACLLQAVPQALNTDIIEVIHASSDRHNSPDSLYGYGIPNMAVALVKLLAYFEEPEGETFVGPNPTTDNIEIDFRQPPGNFTIEILSMTGKLIFRKDFSNYKARTLLLTELQGKEQGMYFLRIVTINKVNVHKIIKLRR